MTSSRNTRHQAPSCAPGAQPVDELAGVVRVPGCTRPVDLLAARARQLQGLTALMHGTYGDAMQDLATDEQAGVLWLASCLAAEVCQLADLVATPRGGQS